MLRSTITGMYCLIQALACQAESHAQLAHLSALGNVAVQEELQLSAEQTEQIAVILKEYRAESVKGSISMTGAAIRGGGRQAQADIRKNRNERLVRIGASHYDKIAKLLRPQQSQRLQGIALQSAERVPARLFAMNPSLAEAVGLDDQQRQQISDIYVALPLRQAADGQEEANKHVMAVLTDAQREKLNELKGERFESGPPIDIFRRNDRNDDGKVAISEASVPFWNSYAEFDTDADEALDRVEFMAGVNRQGVENQRVAMRALFDRNDKNQDGTLSQDEANPFFRSMDLNGDDVVDQDEFREGFARQQYQRMRRTVGQRVLGLSTEGESSGPGLLAYYVFETSPAAVAGIKIRDRVLRINATEIKKVADIRAAVRDGGKEQVVTVLREGAELQLAVKFDDPIGPNRLGGPPAELIDTIFRRNDQNEDGFIAKEEAQFFIERNFDTLDADSDGRIDPQELRERFGSIARGGANVGGEGRMAGFLDRLFARDDKDENGLIAKEEATGFVSQNFERFDANGDGQLDRDEVRQSTQSSFDRNDENNDGVITKEEASSGFFSRNFERFDTNGDGQLDRTEVQQRSGPPRRGQED